MHEGRDRRLSQRGQVLARQPPRGRARGGRPRAPGVTRDRNEVECEWNGRTFWLVDTGGIDFGDDEPLAGSIRDQARAGLAEPQVAVLVVDARAGVRPGDEEMADLLRRAPLPDDRRRQQVRRGRASCRSPPSSTASGWASRCAVSAAQGLGCGELLDRIVGLLPAAEDEPEPRTTRSGSP